MVATTEVQTFTNAQVSSIFLEGHDIDFTSVLLDGWALIMTDGDGDGTETWALSPGVTLAAGPHTLFVNGDIVGTSGSFGGNINITAVPEPATWAMMLLGFGAVGFAMRRRRQPMLAQLA